MAVPRAGAASPARWRYPVYGIAVVLLGVLAGLCVAEMWVRVFRPFPPRQIVRGFGLHSLDGVPVWEVATDRQNRACVERHPERTRILFFGSSITFGTDLRADEVFTAALETRLNATRPTPGFCVLNFAQPGFTFEQKYAVARIEVARYRPALIMWEDWVEWKDYSLIGEAAYGTADYVVRPDGFIGIAGVPDGLNRFLFLHSRFYEYVTLTVGQRAKLVSEDEQATAFANERLIQVPQLAQSVGAKVVFYLAPSLDRPFAATAASPPGWHRILLDFARAHGIPAYPLERALIDQDYLTLRLDPCCHYNAEGHRALVPIMERIILQQLDGRPPLNGEAQQPSAPLSVHSIAGLAADGLGPPIARVGFVFRVSGPWSRRTDGKS
jgi:hypothetical protein